MLFENAETRRREATRTFGYIQVCRAIAAMLVALFHLAGAVSAEKYFNQPFYSHFLRFGSSGVEFFFVLSGFIITYVHAKDLGQPQRLASYAARRAVRVFPSYWIVFGAVAAVASVVPAFREGLPADAAVWLKSLLLLPQDPQVVGGTGAPLIIVAWSMQYELVFYAVFGLMIVSPVAGTVVLALLAAWWLAGGLLGTVPRFPLWFMKPHFFLIFVFGVLAAAVSRRGLVRNARSWVAAGLTLYAGLAAFENAEMIIGALDRYPARLDLVSSGYGVASGFLVCGLVAAEQQHARPMPAWLLTLGEASYVRYLLHYPIISALCKVLSRFGNGPAWTAFSFVLIFLACCCVSVAFHRLIERPILQWSGHRPTR